MALDDEKVMFSIYREAVYNGAYRAVYFTELGDHDRDREINRAMAGESFLDGYLLERSKREAKAIINAALARLNDGQPVDPDELREDLAGHLA